MAVALGVPPQCVCVRSALVPNCFFGAMAYQAIHTFCRQIKHDRATERNKCAAGYLHGALTKPKASGSFHKQRLELLICVESDVRSDANGPVPRDFGPLVCGKQGGAAREPYPRLNQDAPWRERPTGQEGGLMADKKSGEVGKRIVFDAETWRALHQLSLETMRSTQELADEAFHDLLKKHHRPTSLKEMLRQSARLHPANDERTGGQAPVRKK